MNPKKFARKVLPASGVKAAEETYRKGRVHAMQLRYGHPARDLQVIAVTGTNGKTTTCTMLNEILKTAGYKTAMFTTATVEVAGKSEPNRRHTTVPITADLLTFFTRARDAEVDYVVLEVTSHALHQHKVLGVPVEVAVLTNISQDHLDYHGTMEEYTNMKARLFNAYMNPSFCVLNHDDAKYNFFKRQSVGLVSNYGLKPGSHLRISNIENTPAGSTFTLAHESNKVTAQLGLLGSFNVTNAAAAASAATALGLTLDTIVRGIERIEEVPGRMQPVDVGKPYGVIVDYAVTPDALEKSLRSLRERATGKLFVVFGATGDRDKEKRPQMGKAAAAYADKIYLTDDETYNEDPATIRKAVLQGIKQARATKKTTEIADRKQAITAALQEAKKGDIVFCAGIGHQDSRNMGGTLVPWDEVGVVKHIAAATNSE